METEYFQTKAARARCLSVDAAKRIRQFAIKKNGQEGDQTDANLLPVADRVKEAFKSRDYLLQLLRCPCRSLCVPFHDVLSEEEEEKLAKDTWRQQVKLQNFAVFILAGCLFAYKIFHSRGNAAEHLEVFIDAVQKGRESRLRKLLKPDESFEELANLFALCMNDKLRLIRIPDFVTGGQPQHFLENRWNFPFLNLYRQRGGTPGHDRQRFVISDRFINATELKKRPVFCKAITFDRETSVLRPDVKREAEIMSWLAGLKHANIAEVLFLFTEVGEAMHRFNFVFKYHRDTLADIFAGPRNDDALGQFRSPQAGPMIHTSVLDHGLWKAMLGILDAIRAIHEFSSRNGPFDYEEMVEGGHFNLKPASILVADDKGPPRLILAGFGQAHLQKRYLSTAKRRTIAATSLEYAPPECGLGAFSRDRIRACYDIWSLGCILLEVLTYIANEMDGQNANAAMRQFYDERLADGRGDAIHTSAFWKEGGLRPAVVRRIKSLRERKDDRLTEALRQVESMLAVNTKDRPNISECIQSLNSERDLFLHPGHDDLSRKLRKMAISFETANISRGLTPCQMFLWRESMDSETELTLILEWAGGQRWSDSKSLHNDAIIVETYHDTRLHYGRPEQRLQISCRFRRLHRGTTFYFDHWKDFFNFFHLMTHQQVGFGELPDPTVQPSPPPRWGFRFQSIVLNKNLAQHERGMCQIWSTDNHKRHAERFLRPPFAPNRNQPPLSLSPQRSYSNANNGGVARSVAADSGVVINLHRRVSSSTSGGDLQRTSTGITADAVQGRFKLAIFVAREEPGGRVVEETPVVYIVEIDLSDIMLDTTISDPQKVTFKARERLRGSFPLWAPALNDKRFDGGIPLDPEVLKNAIRQESPARVRLQKLEITFMSVDECTIFKDALRYYNV